MSNTPASQSSQHGKTSAKFLLAPVVITVIVLAGLMIADEVSQSNTPVELTNATLYPRDFRPVPAFELQDQHGETFGNAQLASKWTVLFFGFTHCPDVCPTTLNTLNIAYKKLSPEMQQKIQIVLLSVDPERDTQQQRKEYIEYFNPEFIALGGTPEKIKALTQSMYIHYQKTPLGDDPNNYLVDHSAALLIISPDGRRHAQITPPILGKEIAQDLTAMIEAY